MKNNLLLILFVGMFLIAFTQKNKVNENLKYEYLIVSDQNGLYAEIFEPSQKKVEQRKKERYEHSKTLIAKILTEKNQAGWELCETTSETQENGNNYVTVYILRKPITN